MIIFRCQNICWCTGIQKNFIGQGGQNLLSEDLVPQCVGFVREIRMEIVNFPCKKINLYICCKWIICQNWVHMILSSWIWNDVIHVIILQNFALKERSGTLEWLLCHWNSYSLSFLCFYLLFEMISFFHNTMVDIMWKIVQGCGALKRSLFEEPRRGSTDKFCAKQEKGV